MGDMMDMMVIFNIFIAGYLLFYAFKGTGRIYENDYPEEIKESHKQFLRKFCFIVGGGLLLISVLEYTQSFGSVWTIVSMVFILSAVVIYLVVFQKRYRPYLKEQKRDIRKR